MGVNPTSTGSETNVVPTATASDHYLGFSNKILVLSTMHHFELKGRPNPKVVRPLKEVLEKYQPYVICVEALPPEDITEMLVCGDIDAEVAHQFAAIQSNTASSYRSIFM